MSGRAKASLLADQLGQGDQAVIEAALADAFQAAFFGIAAFAALAALLAWTIPMRRI